jgi:hypothetical protein
MAVEVRADDTHVTLYVNPKFIFKKRLHMVPGVPGLLSYLPTLANINASGTGAGFPFAYPIYQG